MAAVEPFKISITERTLDDLKERLSRARWTDDVKETSWESGTDFNYLKEFSDYWLNKYSWRVQERELNRFPHFKAKVDGMDIHFIHARGEGSKRIPILLTHG